MKDLIIGFILGILTILFIGMIIHIQYLDKKIDDKPITIIRNI